MPMELKHKPPKLDFTTCSFLLERQSGFKKILGIDEAGRGCLAGPVVVAGLVFDQSIWDSDADWVQEINDSKKLRPAKRERLYDEIISCAKAWAIEKSDPAEVDAINILQATFRAARRVAEKILKQVKVEMVFMDGNQAVPELKYPQRAIIQGDSISKTIAAASILAKVHRDRLMDEYDKKFPGYGFAKHKGYGTQEHRDALSNLGLCPIHRRSFLKKLEALNRGAESEALVAEWVKALGFEILETNWRTKDAEIDLIAQKDHETHFFEVRSRAHQASLDFSFPASKQSQFKRAVQYYRTSHATRNSHYHLVTVYDGRIEAHWDVFRL